jgi:hypothetical protein
MEQISVHFSREEVKEGKHERVSIHEEEMVSFTENARLEAWRSPEVMKRGSSSGVPSRVGSANPRHYIGHTTNLPPQRPCTPLYVNSVPIKWADCWLAGGQDLSGAHVRRLTPSIPGWMEGLKDVERPNSSLAVRNPRLVQLCVLQLVCIYMTLFVKEIQSIRDFLFLTQTRESKFVTCDTAPNRKNRYERNIPMLKCRFSLAQLERRRTFHVPIVTR